MGLDALLSKLESATPDTPCNPCGVSPKPAPLLGCTPATPDTPQNTLLGGLAELVRRCGERYGFSDVELTEALEAARRDPAGALAAYKAIRQGLGDDPLLEQLAELDALIVRAAQLEGWPPALLAEAQATRRRMRPADVAEALRAFREIVEGKP